MPAPVIAERHRLAVLLGAASQAAGADHPVCLAWSTVTESGRRPNLRDTRQPLRHQNWRSAGGRSGTRSSCASATYASWADPIEALQSHVVQPRCTSGEQTVDGRASGHHSRRRRAGSG